MNGKLIPSIAGIIALGLYFGYVQPTFSSDIASLRQQIASENDSLAAAKEYASRAASLDAERSQIPAASLASAETMLPGSVDTVKLVFDLSALAARSGFSLTNFNVSSLPSKTPGDQGGPVYQPVVVVVSGTGTYNSFRQFLDGVEHSLRIIDVTELSIKSASGTYSYQATLQAYWLPK
ncbi:MAG TPA: type 4a pilus biogenesis protein PilO [Candidatus Paceibacterota bacterium]